jgi:hypothetical protein
LPPFVQITIDVTPWESIITYDLSHPRATFVNPTQFVFVYVTVDEVLVFMSECALIFIWPE